jgi:hypothetical protein
VVPRQPVDQHRRLFGDKRQRLAQHGLIAAQHPLGSDDGLGLACGAGGEQELRHGVGTRAAMRGLRGIRHMRLELGELKHRSAG